MTKAGEGRVVQQARGGKTGGVKWQYYSAIRMVTRQMRSKLLTGRKKKKKKKKKENEASGNSENSKDPGALASAFVMGIEGEERNVAQARCRASGGWWRPLFDWHREPYRGVARGGVEPVLHAAGKGQAQKSKSDSQAGLIALHWTTDSQPSRLVAVSSQRPSVTLSWGCLLLGLSHHLSGGRCRCPPGHLFSACVRQWFDQSQA